jgi:hypothetical protein
VLKQNLKEEYNLLYRTMQYKKFHKHYCYMCYEKNNFAIVTKFIEDLVVELQTDENF